MECIVGDCEKCEEVGLENVIKSSNEQMMAQNKQITWRRWSTPPGKLAPEKCQVKGSLKEEIEDLLQMSKLLKGHLFHANWHKNLFENTKKSIPAGRVIQIFDFAMHFHNIYQDEVQSAYWECSQTAIHRVINYFLCPNCSDVVMLILGQITDHLKDDSFVVRAAHDATFK